MRKILLPAAILANTIIGAGMFAIPYAFVQTGFRAGIFYLSALTATLILLHLMYADIVATQDGDHRLVGYAAARFGKKGFAAASIINGISLFGGLLVYLALGSDFLGAFVKNPTMSLYAAWALCSVALIAGTHLFRNLEWLLATLMAALIAAVYVAGLPHFNPTVGSGDPISGLFLLYGIGLFSLYGASAIPEMKDFFIDKKVTAKIVALGTVLPALLYFLFVVGIQGLSSASVSQDALSGIERYPFFKQIGYLLGLLAVSTSYWALSINLKNVLRFDYGTKNALSVALVLAAPLAVFSFLKEDFITLMGFVGSIAIGLEAMLIVLLYLRIRGIGASRFRIPLVIAFVLLLLFAAGVIQHVIM
ncbi:MAG: hypothetical protein A2939_04240 [Parcubacteria group bacterium RIFCSPLOWO2_01_FULL_48_18]|nr:MAG: hypothetical protein A2939_04240 [Parcubacteria group bacterium RIFCSPLOWO2_01_FULL_48_18]OHB23736.1 MAG: hypothetical protein A3J67_05070 [Parcubacteria group bacterium RIFCSPHIGHO2_02_FULL_48_10b]